MQELEKIQAEIKTNFFLNIFIQLNFLVLFYNYFFIIMKIMNHKSIKKINKQTNI